MLRVPGSINSKYSDNNHVKVIQSWNGFRPNINLLLGSFYAWTMGDKIKVDKKGIRSSTLNCNPNRSQIPWIESLLKMPISDGRKNIVSLVLAPYLINIKRVMTEEAYTIIMTWLEKCERLRKLDSSFKYLVKYALKRSQILGYKPLRLENFKLRNKQLYDMVTKYSTV